MEWLYLALAIAFELTGAVAAKLSEGFSRLGPTLLIFPAYAVSFSMLVLALKAIPISVAYAIWSAVGTAVIAAIGMIWFREPSSLLKLGSIGLIIAGVVGLRLADSLSRTGNGP